MHTSRILLLASVLTASASANIVGWNLDRFGTVSGSRVAGVVPAANWNNSWPSDPTTDLIDSTGTPTTVDLAYSSFNQWTINEPSPSNPSVDADGSYNRNLLNGYLNAGPAGWNPLVTASSATFTQIPYAAYDLIVYFSADAAGREGTVTVGATSFTFNTVGLASISGPNALLLQTTDLSGSFASTANYAIFPSLTGTSQTVTVQMRDNDEWAGIAAVQLVSVPEPTTAAALAGVGAIACALVLRRRRA